MWRTNAKPTALVLLALLFLTAPPILADDAQQLSLDNLDTKRVPAYTVIPDYPKVARRDRIEGEVQVCFEITRDGRTRRIAVRKSTHRLFEKPARRAVRASTYVPVAKDAVVSGIKTCRTFRFTLEPVVVETGT
ncbi:MAG: energy transducer TonB [Gammaproteobacteria bacterium]|nr:energy transducer TonB [Gammaproteobacteria bacterium]MBU2675696.1 energy transducer TonB [Gammaproteobacteria bacterium]NNC56865.1 TonB family protein [Woeseiaceae bacterium]